MSEGRGCPLPLLSPSSTSHQRCPRSLPPPALPPTWPGITLRKPRGRGWGQAGLAGDGLPLGGHTGKRGLSLVPAVLATEFHGATDALAVGVDKDQMSVPGHDAPCQKDSAARPLADTALKSLTLELRGRQGQEGRRGRARRPHLLKEMPLSCRLVREHLAAGVACALLPTRLAAYGCPGLPEPQGLQRAPLPVPTPRGKPFASNSGQPWMLVWLPAREAASCPGKSTGFSATKSWTEDLDPPCTSVVSVKGLPF